MKIQEPITWIGAAVALTVGASVEIWALILLLRGERGFSAAPFAISGLPILIIAAGQILSLRRAAKADKPLDKPPASRHLAGPGRIWRPR
jgi:hypothetical protein